MRKLFKKLFLVAIALMIAFIWSNSLKSVSESLEQSEGVKKVVRDVLTFNGTKPLTKSDGWILDNLRKLAHFTEFCVLSMLITAYISAFYRNRKTNYLFVFIVMGVAIIDEVIQIFSNRGSSVVDVFIDCCGGLVGFGIAIAVTFMVVRIVKLKTKRHDISK